MIDEDKVYSTKEAAEMCGYTYWGFVSLPSDRRPIGFRRNGGHIVYRGRAIKEWLEQQEAKYATR